MCVITNHKKESVTSCNTVISGTGTLGAHVITSVFSLLSVKTATINGCRSVSSIQSPAEASLRYHPHHQPTDNPLKLKIIVDAWIIQWVKNRFKVQVCGAQ